MPTLRFSLFLVLAISLRVSPLVSFAPATLTISVRVQPEPSDRQIVVLLDSGNFGRRSEWTIDPERCPKLFSWHLDGIPEGSYEVTAQIGSWSAVRASDRVTVEIH